MLNTVILHCMSVKKFRWSKDYESAEEELIELLERKNITAHRVHVDPHEEMQLTTITLPAQLWLAEGSCTLDIATRHYSMQPGDAIEIPEDIDISGTSGMTGCAYYWNSTKH